MGTPVSRSYILGNHGTAIYLTVRYELILIFLPVYEGVIDLVEHVCI